ncbi:(deoxy)nucleoside triphosphate pyrophosphohydrolase [Caloramator sp. CAR-1]|jgi:8-oxo-dGTP diphosphatase|uniref:(deoxy)nucleoside triphosphate pyrophosphohydrolase n=2 Tax=unclassified Caloramator TaxID=2629145 RepID=UPI0026E32FFB|nr:(deoxy)nucleoside triphosphate pyrophosphohydrolase [Caloramator sp. CAR-1]MDO6354630.1 (deoxy)nucleoside triphosphate pyrophosphohydrolase [Caloramator sp. CAR-1]
MKVVTAAIIIDNDRVFIARRKDGNIKGKWEFPGGKLEENETYEECLKREIYEELKMNIEIIKPFEEVVHEYDNGKIKLISFLVKPLSYDYKLSVHDDARWVSIDDLLNYDLAPADIPIAKKLQEELKTKE